MASADDATADVSANALLGDTEARIAAAARSVALREKPWDGEGAGRTAGVAGQASAQVFAWPGRVAPPRPSTPTTSPPAQAFVVSSPCATTTTGASWWAWTGGRPAVRRLVECAGARVSRAGEGGCGRRRRPGPRHPPPIPPSSPQTGTPTPRAPAWGLCLLSLRRARPPHLAWPPAPRPLWQPVRRPVRAGVKMEARVGRVGICRRRKTLALVGRGPTTTPEALGRLARQRLLRGRAQVGLVRLLRRTGRLRPAAPCRRSPLASLPSWRARALLRSGGAPLHSSGRPNPHRGGRLNPHRRPHPTRYRRLPRLTPPLPPRPRPPPPPPLPTRRLRPPWPFWMQATWWGRWHPWKRRQRPFRLTRRQQRARSLDSSRPPGGGWRKREGWGRGEAGWGGVGWRCGRGHTRPWSVHCNTIVLPHVAAHLCLRPRPSPPCTPPHPPAMAPILVRGPIVAVARPQPRNALRRATPRSAACPSETRLLSVAAPGEWR